MIRILAVLTVMSIVSVPAARAQNAADRYYDPAEMAKARDMMMHHHGGQTMVFLEADRLEVQSNNGEPLFVWDAQGWIGGDRHKFWFKSEGEYLIEEGEAEEFEVQGLYSYAVGPFFELQAGIRHDFEPGPARTFGVLGVEGLLPYFFELDAAAFFSEDGDVLGRIEAEYEFLLTQRLILQPRTELNFAAQEDALRGIGAGLSTLELGARLRYEILREVAPYIGVSWQRAFGDTADFVRAEGENADTVSAVVGIRLWY